MDEFDAMMENGFGVDYQTISTSAKLSSITKSLAKDILNNAYVTPGSWFKSLSDSDVDALMEMVDIEDEESEEMAELMLLTLMLTSAEGVELSSYEDVSKSIGAMRMLTATVSLARKGLVDVFYENISFGSDAHNLIVAKKRDDVDYEKLRREFGGEDE